MSLRTLPILFLNLGGEMLYILDQRLRAQSIPDEKARKVMHDIIGTMFNKRFMEELFKPQDTYSKKAMRTVFDRLAHASIMRLNSASMDKLYDLMTMAFKYQVSLCLRPSDVLLVTYNHMDAIRSFASDNPAISNQVENVYKLLYETYAKLNAGQFQIIRQTLLSFFQDMHIRVSIFLKDKVQNANGKFVLPADGAVPWDTEVPGSIRYLNTEGQISRTSHFVTGCRYQLPDKPGSFELLGDRVIKLGSNMYTASKTVDTVTSSPAPAATAALSAVTKKAPGSTVSVASVSEPQGNPNPLAKAELNLLAHLVGGSSKKPESQFRLNFFSTDEEEEQAAIQSHKEAPHRVIKIDATKKEQRKELANLMNEFSIEGSGDREKGDELLDLMDQA
ncbi:protein OSCP1-like [Stylophora pistillata]|uniref:Protein OSCP1 n=1 Tax=Stylophora pistillata TaxID=50429 RepID=A0A2B4SY90_STYPI|nr:protein OSCP1-like [Stylophora pistillata]PFX34073.1 Protein OSCP1 [Stylophora pistillata]